jgi:hypothetical protein
MTHERATELTARYFSGTCGEDWPALAEHLRSCESCRGRFEEARRAFVTGNGDDPDSEHASPRELDLLAKVALARYDARRRTRRRFSSGIALGATAIVGLALLVVRGRDGKTDGDGPVPAPRPRLGADVGAKILCHQPDDLARYQALSVSGSCPPGSLVKVQATSMDPKLRAVSALVVGERLEKVGLLRSALSTNVPMTLEGHVALPDRSIGVIVVFSSEPLTDEVLVAALGHTAARHRTLAELPETPLELPHPQKLLVIDAKVVP